MKKLFAILIVAVISVSLSSCGKDSEYESVKNEKFPDIWRELVGDPMDAYFFSEEYETKSDPKSNNPIYSEDSFIKGTYPLDEDVLDYEVARVIMIQFKEMIDENDLFNGAKPAVTILYGSHGKDVTNQYNFTYDSVSQKLLLTKQSAGLGFGSGNFTEVTTNGNLLHTAEIADTNIRYDDGREEHIEGQRSRQLSGEYTFLFYT